MSGSKRARRSRYAEDDERDLLADEPMLDRDTFGYIAAFDLRRRKANEVCLKRGAAR